MYRELRTYAEAVDGLLRGNTLQVLDLLTQQFRATCMAIDEKFWSTARHLQLVPPSQTSAVGFDDLDRVRRIEQAEVKAAELRKKLAVPH